jgi:hypothetical protein
VEGNTDQNQGLDDNRNHVIAERKGRGGCVNENIAELSIRTI